MGSMCLHRAHVRLAMALADQTPEVDAVAMGDGNCLDGYGQNTRAQTACSLT